MLPCQGVCAWCGEHMDLGAALADVVDRATFNNWDKLRAPDAGYVCAACTWCTTGRPPEALRFFSVLYREDAPCGPSSPAAPAGWLGSGRVAFLDRRDLSAIRSALLFPPSGPWACGVAKSGKIHVLPFAPVNGGGPAWSVRFERVTVRSSGPAFAAVVGAVAELLAAGYYKSEIASGEPHPSRLAKLGLATWRAADHHLRPLRGSPLLELALFLESGRDG